MLKSPDSAVLPAAVPSTPRKIRVLLLEDRMTDAELMVRELRRAGFDPDWRRVETEAEFDAQLNPRVDVILADFRLPRYDGLSALQLVQRQNLEIPFIIVSGTLGDELAVKCIKQGVTDYLLKDRMERLGLAVSNALEERRLRAEAKLVEEQLRQAQKMESIGQLAGGIAHDFNNVLTVINGRACILLEDSSLPSAIHDALREIYIAGERASNLTRQLLMFSRKRSICRTSLVLNEVLEEIGQMIRRLIGEQIEFGLNLARDLPPIDADEGMLEQLAINLAVNARDAMPRGGTLTIETDAIELSAADVRGRAEAKAGLFVRLSVEDTGTGIAPDILPRIFEPFFTTKSVGRGTGLGLATVFGIVKQHGGWLEVESQLGVGTAFHVYLPAAAGAVLPAKQSNAALLARGGRETVLIVEDEVGVREFAAAVLQPLGYRVLQARSGREALEVWGRHRERIDLLVTDMILPEDLTGQDLAAKLRADKPSLGVVYTSGYFEDTGGRVFESTDTSEFLHKPYHPRALANAVRQMLDARASQPRASATPA